MATWGTEPETDEEAEMAREGRAENTTPMVPISQAIGAGLLPASARPVGQALSSTPMIWKRGEDGKKKLIAEDVPELEGVSLQEFRTLQVCCPDCRGLTKFVFGFVDRCPTCLSSRLVCPTCTGARMVCDHSNGKQFGTAEACHDCMVYRGPNFEPKFELDPDRELMNIEHWLRGWRERRDAAQAAIEEAIS